jgi:Tfp pilus assembly protein PilN
MSKNTAGKINFLPEDYLERRAQRRTNIVCLFLFVLVMTGVVGAYVVTQGHKKAKDMESAQVGKELQAMHESLKQVDALETKKKQMEEKAAVSAMLIEPVPRSLLLAIITNHMPEGVSLTDYKLATKEIVDKNAEAAKKTAARDKKSRLSGAGAAETAEPSCPQTQTLIELTGLAQNDIQVANFIANLNRSKLLGQVDLGMSKEYKISEETLRQFKLNVILPPGSRAGYEDVQLARQWREKRKAGSVAQTLPGHLK